MQIGLNISKTFNPDIYTSIDVGFWMVEEIKQNRIKKLGYISIVPYTDLAFWVTNGDNSFYAPGRIVFSISPGNWPFVTGTDPVSKAWTFIKSHTQTQDSDGNEINGGLDWSTATDVMYP